MAKADQDPGDRTAFTSIEFLAEATGGPRMRLAASLRDCTHVLGTLVENRLRAEPDALPYAYLRILDALEQRPRSSGRQLARAVVVTPQTVAAILNRLEAAAYVSRAPHEENRRADRWSLTETGALRCRELRDAVERGLADVFRGVSRREIADIAKAMNQLADIVLRAAERSGAL
ncbi:MAG: MarR family transcriptional regulator [Burkholderiaceae bacterium]